MRLYNFEDRAVESLDFMSPPSPSPDQTRLLECNCALHTSPAGAMGGQWGGCQSERRRGEVTSFRWELEDPMALRSFTDKLFLMIGIG